MRYILLGSIVLSSYTSFSQTPDDAIRQSFQIPGGSARNMAVGGAMGSLGGDITAANVNPAGLGFFRTSEVVLSPGFNFINNKFNFRGTSQSDKKSNFSYGASGIVLGWGNDRSKRSGAFSISVNQLANFNNYVHYKGFNNVSSWSEQYLEELIRDKAGLNAAENSYPFGSSLAYNTYLVDTIMHNGQLSGYQSLVPISQGVTQENIIDTKGGIHEIALGFASNTADKLYLGGSINVPIYSYTKNQTYRESDPTNNVGNSFSYFEYKEKYTSRGVGVNLKLGLIYKPADKFRLGVAIHTPTFASMTDNISSSMTTNTEGFHGTKSQSSSEFTSNDGSPLGVYKYVMSTPWKALVSASYVFNEVSDVRKQKAFITADIEYIRHQGTQYSISEDGTDSDKRYYQSVNNAIDQRYKGAFNFRLGGEVKFTTIMARAGFAYYGNPYQDKVLKNNRMLLSGGLGYRDKGMFVDLTYVYAIMNDTHVPYYLSDRPNTFATGKNTKGNVVLTFGFKIM